jgi:hypothetical protein
MTEIIENDWTDIWLMFADIKAHAKNNGRAIIGDDQPTLRRLGWKCPITGKQWLITIGNIQRSAGNGDQRAFLMKYISNAQGKAELIKILNSDGLDNSTST